MALRGRRRHPSRGLSERRLHGRGAVPVAVRVRVRASDALGSQLRRSVADGGAEEWRGLWAAAGDACDCAGPGGEGAGGGEEEEHSAATVDELLAATLGRDGFVGVPPPPTTTTA